MPSFFGRLVSSLQGHWNQDRDRDQVKDRTWDRDRNYQGNPPPRDGDRYQYPDKGRGRDYRDHRAAQHQDQARQERNYLRRRSRVRDQDQNRDRTWDRDRERHGHRHLSRDRDGVRAGDRDRDYPEYRRQDRDPGRERDRDRMRDRDPERPRDEYRDRDRDHQEHRRQERDPGRDLGRDRDLERDRDRERTRDDHRDRGRAHKRRESPHKSRHVEEPKTCPPVPVPHHDVSDCQNQNQTRSHPTSATLSLKPLDPRDISFTMKTVSGTMTLADVDCCMRREYERRQLPISATTVLTLYDSHFRPLPRDPDTVIPVPRTLTAWYRLTTAASAAEHHTPRWKFTRRGDYRERSLEGPFWDGLRQAIEAGETVMELKRRIARHMGIADENCVVLVARDGIRRGTLHGNHWTLRHLRTTWLCRWLTIDTVPPNGYVTLRGFNGAEYMWYPKASDLSSTTTNPDANPNTPTPLPRFTAGFLPTYLTTRILQRVHRRDRTALLLHPSCSVRLLQHSREVLPRDVLEWGGTYDFELAERSLLRAFLREEAWLQRADQTCGLCVDDKKRADMVLWRVAAGCKEHADECCRECMAEYLRLSLESGGWERLRCPMCGAGMGWEDVKMGADREVFERFDELVTRAELGRMEGFYWCLNSGCKSGQILAEDGECSAGGEFRCVECKERYCVRHTMPWHEGETCEEYDRRMGKRERDEELSRQVAEMGTMACPGCKRPIMKEEGCNHIRCVCGSEWCYRCGGLYVTDARGRSRCNHQPDCPTQIRITEWPVRPPTPLEDFSTTNDAQPEEIRMAATTRRTTDAESGGLGMASLKTSNNNEEPGKLDDRNPAPWPLLEPRRPSVVNNVSNFATTATTTMNNINLDMGRRSDGGILAPPSRPAWPPEGQANPPVTPSTSLRLNPRRRARRRTLSELDQQRPALAPRSGPAQKSAPVIGSVRD